MAQLKPFQLCSIGKVMVHSGFNQVLCVGLHRKLVYMDDQRDLIVSRKLSRPTDDELFSVIVEVSFLKR
jgi:hypothetical protein